MSGGLILSLVVLNTATMPFTIPYVMAHADGYGILNTLPYYGADLAYAHIAAYSPEAQAAYHRILGLDVLVLIPLYVVALGAAIAHGGRRVLRGRMPGLLTVLCLAPLIAGGLNLIEDGLVFRLMAEYPARHDGLAILAGWCTSLKTALITLSALSAIALNLTVGFSVATWRVGLRSCHI